MEKRTMIGTALAAIAVIPSLIGDTRKMRRDIMKAGKQSSKMVMNKMGRKRSVTGMIVTGLGGYLLAHATPIKGLIRDK